MFLLRNNRSRAASLFTGILLLVVVVSYRDLFYARPESPVAAEFVHLAGPDVSRAAREASFFQPIIQFTVKVHARYGGENRRVLPVEEGVLYKRR
jgi:hypothetical protein